jgi:septal ring factor EnvC (AmiA/AmiB activator)
VPYGFPQRKKSKDAELQQNMPEARKTLAERLRACKRKLEKAVAQLRPDGPLDFDEKDIEKFIKDLSDVLAEIENAPEQTRFLRSKEGAYNHLVAARFKLLGAKEALKILLEMKSQNKFDREVHSQYMYALFEAYGQIRIALKEFIIKA